ncbi:hypothetical protein D9B85_14685, partial [Corynebacterium diphtheriae]
GRPAGRQQGLRGSAGRRVARGRSCAAPGAERWSPLGARATLTNWDTFQQLLEGLDEQSVWTQRYALEHLLFPDRAPKIVSRDDRQAVSKAFAGRLGGELPVDEVARRLEPNAG